MRQEQPRCRSPLTPLKLSLFSSSLARHSPQDVAPHLSSPGCRPSRRPAWARTGLGLARGDAAEVPEPRELERAHPPEQIVLPRSSSLAGWRADPLGEEAGREAGGPSKGSQHLDDKGAKQEGADEQRAPVAVRAAQARRGECDDGAEELVPAQRDRVEHRHRGAAQVEAELEHRCLEDEHAQPRGASCAEHIRRGELALGAEREAVGEDVRDVRHERQVEVGRVDVRLGRERRAVLSEPPVPLLVTKRQRDDAQLAQDVELVDGKVVAERGERGAGVPIELPLRLPRVVHRHRRRQILDAAAAAAARVHKLSEPGGQLRPQPRERVAREAAAAARHAAGWRSAGVRRPREARGQGRDPLLVRVRRRAWPARRLLRTAGGRARPHLLLRGPGGGRGARRDVGAHAAPLQGEARRRGARALARRRLGRRAEQRRRLVWGPRRGGGTARGRFRPHFAFRGVAHGGT
mmetsp:Transcript_15674/g.51729  ORF Transcript_15674/g.51729 Transcript_15674/m.51729 type:complete len:464 (+) Transcript_15674:2112-3503(+)